MKAFINIGGINSLYSCILQLTLNTWHNQSYSLNVWMFPLLDVGIDIFEGGLFYIPKESWSKATNIHKQYGVYFESQRSRIISNLAFIRFESGTLRS